MKRGTRRPLPDPIEPRGPRRAPHVKPQGERDARRELRAMGMMSNDPRKWTGRARLGFRYGRVEWL